MISSRAESFLIVFEVSFSMSEILNNTKLFCESHKKQ